MRDIRADIQERIADVEAELEDLRRQLERENKRMGGPIEQARTGFQTEVRDTLRSPVSDNMDERIKFFIVKLLEKSIKSKEEITSAAINAGYFRNSTTSPGRSIHLTMINLLKGGSIRKREDGRYESA